MELKERLNVVFYCHSYTIGMKTRFVIYMKFSPRDCLKQNLSYKMKAKTLVIIFLRIVKMIDFNEMNNWIVNTVF